MWFKKGIKWQLETDVLVVGSGGAGMTAALAAQAQGAKVLLIDKAPKVGGTTAVSGGVMWIPNNHHMPEAGVPDSREEALRYTRRLADGRSDDKLLETFLDFGPQMVKFIEAATPLKLSAIKKYPDYHPEFDGGKPGARSLDPGIFDTNSLGAWKDRLRRSPIFGMTVMSVTEATDWGVFSNPLKLPWKQLGKRLSEGLTSSGGALCGGLLKGLLDKGIEPQLGVAARELVVDNGRVVGLRAEKDGRELLIGAKRGVILASGGFEWNKDLCAQFLGGQLTHPNSPPGNDGDGLKMVMALGADLANMSEAWWCPSVVIPGEEYDGRQLNRGDFAIRSLPHSIIVNRRGKRFVNEAHNYNDMMKPFFDFDAVDYERPNLPAHLVFDHAFVEKYALLTVVPGMPLPEWIVKADTLEELAAKIGVDARGLSETVTRFNDFARDGVDKDFRRGERVYDHFYGDPANTPNPNLGSVAKAPFYALQVHPGGLGTKGGAKVTPHAQVVKVDGETIPGLYAAGNVMAGVTGPGYPGAGATIGTGMTFGYIAGAHAAQQRPV
jgi:succinate dehydrogenase/fumarate reductase flavoprotein subunit